MTQLTVLGLTVFCLVMVVLGSGAATAAGDEPQPVLLPVTVTLHDLPVGTRDGNGLGRGLELLLAQVGVVADYDTLMGDLGLAFLTPASDQATRYDGALDVGWWPLEPCYCPFYLDFAGAAAGRRVEHWSAPVPGQPDPEGLAARAQARVAQSLVAGRPVLANHDFWKVVTGCDRETPPLLGVTPWTPRNPPQRLPGPAWVFVAVGEAQPPLDRRQADLEALRHAVALARDEVALPGGYVSGQKAYALWAATLRDLEHLGQARWHANMKLHLGLNRHSAPLYLQQMAGRHPEAVAVHLKAAAELYGQSLAKLATANTGEAALGSPTGREALARLVEGMAALEARAAEELQTAITAAGP